MDRTESDRLEIKLSVCLEMQEVLHICSVCSRFMGLSVRAHLIELQGIYFGRQFFFRPVLQTVRCRGDL